MWGNFTKESLITGDLIAYQRESGKEQGKIMADLDQTEQGPSKDNILYVFRTRD